MGQTDFTQPATGGGSGPSTSLPTGGTISTEGYYDNAGAVVLTVFDVAATDGLHVRVARVASFEIQLTPAAGKKIFWSGSPLGMVVDKALRLLSDGDTVTFDVDANGDVHVTSEYGDLVEEA